MKLRGMGWVIFGGMILSMVTGSMMLVGKATGQGYACLLASAARQPSFIFDRVSGFVQQVNNRYTLPQVINARGAISPDGTYVAYLTGKAGEAITLYLESAAPSKHFRGGTTCSERVGCWRTIREPGAVPLQAGVQDAIGIGWSRDGLRVAFAWLDGKGRLNVAAADPAGGIFARRVISTNNPITSVRLTFHGWTEDDHFAVFSFTSPIAPNRLYFWSPQEDRLVSYDLPQREPPHLAMAWSGGQLAYVANAEQPYLMVAQPEAESEIAFPLSSPLEWWLLWSPDGSQLAARYFDPPHWRVDIFEPEGVVIADVGSAQTEIDRRSGDSEPFIAWAEGGRKLLMTRERLNGLHDLMSVDPHTLTITVLMENLHFLPFQTTSGMIALFPREGQWMSLYSLDPETLSLKRLASGMETVDTVSFMSDGNSLAYISQREGLFAVEAVRLGRGEHYLLTHGLPAVEKLEESDAGDITFNWYTPSNSPPRGGAMSFSLTGEALYHFRVDGRVSAITPSPNGALAAVNVLSNLDTSVSLQIAPADGGDPTPRLASERQMFRPVWSPDGVWLAVRRTQSGGLPNLEIYDAQGTLARRFPPAHEFQDITWITCGG